MGLAGGGGSLFLSTLCPLPLVPLPFAFDRNQFPGGPFGFLLRDVLPGVVGAKPLSAPVALQQGLLLVILAEGIGAEVAEGSRGLATNVAVVPRALPLACHGKKKKRIKYQLRKMCQHFFMSGGHVEKHR